MQVTSRCVPTSRVGEEDPVATRHGRHTRELSEDIDVAIDEFLERQPDASRQEVLQAIRLTRRGRSGGWLRRFVDLAIQAVSDITRRGDGS